MKPSSLAVLFSCSFILFVPLLLSQNPYGSGVDGNLDVTSGSMTTDAVRTSVAGLNSKGALFINVADASIFTSGDEVLIMTMIDPETELAKNSAGNYETAFVATTDTENNILNLTAPLTHSYNTASGKMHQIMRVPHYGNVTVADTAILTCVDWNGFTGGVLSFRANGSVIVNAGGQIHANGKGYRGGLGNYPNGEGGGSGEGITGNFDIESGGPAANGAGHGNGGGGGGNGTNGEPSLFDQDNFGVAVGDQVLTKLIMGGGGGGGSDNDGNRNNSSQARGGDGGGIVIIYAQQINADIIAANGIDGTGPHPNNTNDNSGNGAGGGGAGGSIYLVSKNITVNELKSTGGIGGETFCTTCWPNQDRNGGNGGDGRIRLDGATQSITDAMPTPFSGSFLNITHAELTNTPVTTSPYIVEAFIVDDEADPITGATLNYRVNGGSFIPVTMTTGDSVLFTANIPAQSGGDVVDYYLEATDTGGTPTTESNYTAPLNAPTETFSFTISGAEPVNSTLSTAGDGTVTLDWLPPSDVSNLSGYSIHRNESIDFTPDSNSLVTTLTNTASTYVDNTDSSLLDFRTYYYTITADYDFGGGHTSSHAVTHTIVINYDTITTVRGVVKLEDQTNHANINIVFTKASPAGEDKTEPTDALGNFEFTIVNGSYKLTYEKDGFQTFARLSNIVASEEAGVSIIDDIDLGEIILNRLGTANVSGDISGEWSENYAITGNVTIPAGETLVIRPGTKIQFETNSHFSVNGTLIAVGTPEDPIVFTSLPANQVQARGQWQGIGFNDSSDDNAFLFSVELSFQSELNGNVLSNELKDIFSQSGHPLSGTASITWKADDRVWRIEDVGSVAGINNVPIYYTIKKTGIGLDVYQQSIIRHAIVEYAVDGVYWNISNGELDDVIVRENSERGIEIQNDGSDPLIRNTEIYNNSQQGIYSNEGDPFLIGVISRNNSLSGFKGDNNVDITVIDSQFSNNSDHGIWLNHVNGSLTLLDSTIDDNNDYGLRVRGYLTVERSTISNNTLTGIYSNEGNNGWINVKISDSVIDNNRDIGIYLVHRARPESFIRNCTISRNGNPLLNNHPAIRMHYRIFMTFEDNFIVNNHHIGILYNTHGASDNTPIINRNIIAYNFFDGIYKDDGSVTSTIINNTIYQNGDDGIDIRNATGAEFITNNIIANNGVNGIRADATIEGLEFNNFFGNSETNISNLLNVPPQSLVFVSNNVNGTTSDIFANISEDPLFNFASGNNLDFSLSSSSLCINAGDPGLLDPDGTELDIGAVYRDSGSPHSIQIDSFTDHTVLLSWTPVLPGVHGAFQHYKVYFKTDTDTNFTPFGSTTTNSNIDVTGLTNNELYEFKVSAVYDSGESDLSNSSAFERPGTPAFSAAPVAFKLDIPAEGLTENLTLNNLGTRNLDVAFLLGPEKGSTHFDSGFNDWLTVGNHAHLSGFTELTMECWVYRIGDNTKHQEFMGKHFQEYAFYFSNGRLGVYKGYFSVANERLYQSFTTNYIFPQSEWHHVAVTWAENFITFYIDGELLQQFDHAHTLPIHDWGYSFEISRRSGGGFHLYGNLAEVRVWNFSRNQDQIKSYMNAALRGDEVGLQGYWPLRTNFNDVTSFAKHGTKGGNTVASASNTSPPTLPKLPFTLSANSDTNVQPNTPVDVIFTFSDVGTNNTTTQITPILTNVPDDMSTIINDESIIKYEMALSYGTVAPTTPIHFLASSIDQTGDEYTVVITDATIITRELQNGGVISVGDEIGVFDGNRLVGSALFSGSFNLVISVYGGAGGFTSSQMTFKIYDTSASLEATTLSSFFIGSGAFNYNTFSSLTLDGTIFVTQSVNLTGAMFNLISTNLLPRFPLSNTVFGDLNTLQIVSDDQGRSFIPAFFINTIGDIDFKDGYHIYTDVNEILSFEGTTIDGTSFSIILESGKWNSIAFIGDGLEDVTTAFGDINDSIAAVQTSTGLMYEPAMSINTIQNLDVGLGYQVLLKSDVTNNITFTYNDNGPAGGARSQSARSIITHNESAFSTVSPTGKPYNMIIAGVDDHLEFGDSLGVFDGDICVGSAAYSGGENINLTAWEEISSSSATGNTASGFTSSNPIAFKINRRGDIEDIQINVDGTFSRGDGTFGSAHYAIVNLNAPTLMFGSVNLSDASETVANVTNQRLIDLSIDLNGTESETTWLITEDPVQPDAGDSRWVTTKPDHYEITGAEGNISVFVWTKNANDEIQLVSDGAQSQITFDQELSFKINATNSNVSQLLFGKWTYATNDLDANIDAELASGARSASGTTVYLSQKLTSDPTQIRKLISDYRPEDELLTRWRLVVEGGGGSIGTNLSFEVDEIPAGMTLVIQELMGEIPYDPPIEIAPDITIDLTHSAVFEIALGTPNDSNFELSDGWNLISIPTMTSETIANVFQNQTTGEIKDGPIWSWDGSDFQNVLNTGVLNPEMGYWVKSAGGGISNIFNGIEADGVISLKAGWSLIGAIIPSTLSSQDPAVKGKIWYWDDGNQTYKALSEGEMLQPGNGYWIYSDSDTVIELE